MILALILSATATVTVHATIASTATLDLDGDCARLVSNDPDAYASLDGQRLVANADWLCPLDPAPEPLMYAHLVRLR